MEILLTKLPGGGLVPGDEIATEYLQRVKSGTVLRADVKRMRNARFHRKFHAMVRFAYDQWEPGDDAEWRGVKVEKSYDRFYKDAIIMAGFYEPVFNIKGDLRMEAKSISFANMDEDEFEQVYTRVLDKLIEIVLRHKGYNRQKVNDIIDQLAQFG